MATLQYRQGGDGSIILYRRYEIPKSFPLIGGLGFWKKQEYFTSRKNKEIANLVDTFEKLVKQVRVVENLIEKEKTILEQIKNSRQDNPFAADPFEGSVSKDHKKYLERISLPESSEWKRVMRFVRDLRGVGTPIRGLVVDTTIKPDRIHFDQKVGYVVDKSRYNKQKKGEEQKPNNDGPSSPAEW